MALLRGNLRDLVRVNRWLGGTDLSWRALRHVVEQIAGAPPETLALLDIGTGAGDIPLGLLRRATARGWQLQVEATDVRPEIVSAAGQRLAGMSELSVSLAPANRLDQEDDSLDVVHASLLLHHLEPPAVVRLLVEMARVARLAVIINELDRARRWWLAAWLLSRLATGNHYTRHDAPLSVQRAYRPDELSGMASSAGLLEVARLHARPAYRYALVLVPQR